MKEIENTNKIVDLMLKEQGNVVPVLDTCILLADPDLTSYENKVIYVPLSVFSELDVQKEREGVVGFKARAVNGRMNFPKYSEEKACIYHDGAKNIYVLSPNDDLENKTSPFVDEIKADDNFMNLEILRSDISDDIKYVLHTADRSLGLLMRLSNKNVEFIKNPNRAFLCNIYSGHKDIIVKDNQINDLSKIDTRDLHPNQYLVIKSASGHATRLGKVKGSKVVTVRDDKSLCRITPRNKEQKFLVDAILDDDIKIIILSGRAGTGKTLLALAGGMEGIDTVIKDGEKSNRKYNQLILAKSLAPLSKQEEVGFLPGDLLDKLLPQFANYTSNFEVLSGGKKKPFKKDGIMLNAGESEIQYRMDKGEVALMSLDSVLGASFDRKYIIVDEAQSLNFDTLKCLCQRITDNSKLILLGDILQSTSSMSSPDKSALFIANRFLKDAKSVATLSLSSVERGKACEEVGEILESIQL
ncbi:MAG: PhoH family protein [Bacteroidales bacterium]